MPFFLPSLLYFRYLVRSKQLPYLRLLDYDKLLDGRGVFDAENMHYVNVEHRDAWNNLLINTAFDDVRR